MPVEPWSVATLAVRASMTAYSERQQIASTWHRIITKIMHRQSSIAITGVGGVGKTVLSDYLSGDGLSIHYSPPGRSVNQERKELYSSKRLTALTIVPGQVSPQKDKSLDELFDGQRRVDGVIHVVSNGFITLREQDARELAQEHNDLERFREFQRNKEVEEFKELIGHVKSSHRKGKGPSWLLLAVNKVDLYYEDTSLKGAYRHYAAPGGQFFACLDQLGASLGRTDFEWDALPVCASLSNFIWEEEGVPSRLLPDQRNKLLLGLLKAIDDRISAS
ncbi:GTPase domain-containing protein [Streptomyces cacaoi]|uniref:GTPase domain-containing protein n=1 Tax=Streptomyces cacaoi TaxID=1898 RepID=UPI0037495CFF